MENTSGSRHVDPAASVRRLANLLDAAVRIPGTNIRIGLDPILGLVPGIGDLAGTVLSGYVVLAAVRLGVPRPVLARMLANLGVDAVVGAVPLLGDIFDVAWRANSRNLALIETHVASPGVHLPVRDRKLDLAIVLAIGTLAALAILLSVLAFRAVLTLFD